jgi:hypothetical protein
MVYDRPEVIGAVFGKTEVESVQAIGQRLARLERQFKKLSNVALSA